MNGPGTMELQNGRRPLFYRLDLFEHGEVTTIEFFDPHEFSAAKKHAANAVNSGRAVRAEVHDEARCLYAYPEIAQNEARDAG